MRWSGELRCAGRARAWFRARKEQGLCGRHVLESSLRLARLREALHQKHMSAFIQRRSSEAQFCQADSPLVILGREGPKRLLPPPGRNQARHALPFDEEPDRELGAGPGLDALQK